MKPKINHSKCVECYMCISACPNNAIRISNKTGKPYIVYDKCTNCGKCIEACPLKIIKRNRRNDQRHRRN